jgi:uncharacterized surface protein with fasciclin (FAS1) repeats
MVKLLVKNFDYNGKCITFKAENGEIYVNATHMGKPFEKNQQNGSVYLQLYHF